MPQAFLWVDTPIYSNEGLPHALEHLIAGKGTKGRYSSLLTDMLLSRAEQATFWDFNFYDFASGTGIDGFWKLFHSQLDALMNPDFTDAEAQTEFYHFGVVTDAGTNKKRLVESGTVYSEMEAKQGVEKYRFELNSRLLGKENPFSFQSGGAPDAMRAVTPEEIQHFYRSHYRLGPGMGFIFALSARENLATFVDQLSAELRKLSPPNSAVSIVRPRPDPNEPKYPITSSEDHSIQIYPFPSESQTDAGAVRFGWKPTNIESMVDLRLLQLFFRALARGEQSVLQTALIDNSLRQLNSGATEVNLDVFLRNSPHFPIWNIEVSGIPGDRISTSMVEKMREVILDKIQEIIHYPAGSPELARFNALVEANTASWRRHQRIWLNSPPGFGAGNYRTDWKEHLENLETNPSFVRSISEEPLWRSVEQRMASHDNIWPDLIRKAHLLDEPYATASMPSPRLVEDLRQAKTRRSEAKIAALKVRYHTSDDQEALERFEKDELTTTRGIDQIENRVQRPSFTENPPLTPDDDIRYRQFEIERVPAIVATFDHPPTIDIGLSFDLRHIPRKYYRYLPILPRMLDSIGLEEAGRTVPYSEFLSQIRKEIANLSTGFESDPISKRADLTIRASASDAAEFQKALDLIKRMVTSNNLDLANIGRLQDIVNQRLSEDSIFTKQRESDWIDNPVQAFRYQNDELFLALNSHFTNAHWDARLKWLFHPQVKPDTFVSLHNFATSTLSSLAGMSRADADTTLRTLSVEGLQKELVDYWRENLNAFEETELVEGLQQLTIEVQQDLQTGPSAAIRDLKDLQRLVISRHGLYLDLMMSEPMLTKLRPQIATFLKTIASNQQDAQNQQSEGSENRTTKPAMEAKLEKRYGAVNNFPFYLGFSNPGGITGDIVFTAQFSGYSDLDRQSLVNGLSSKLLAGSGPQSFFMKTWEAGLAYNNGVTSSPETRLIQYYADRITDMPAVLGLVNSLTEKIPVLDNRFLVDYVFRQAFSIPRSMDSPSQREQALVGDLRDGNDPAKVRRYSEAILQLRRDSMLPSELSKHALSSICGVLLQEKCKLQQKKSRSIFFFINSERGLDEAERRLGIPKILRLWPSDYWIS
ncbi:MAG TPA: hypothetical protein VKZ53_08950 [Candidatus Angelobacter sp.]|nr:hypothetical protein [Candidatus Angelobacter sp.]